MEIKWVELGNGHWKGLAETVTVCLITPVPGEGIYRMTSTLPPTLDVANLDPNGLAWLKSQWEKRWLEAVADAVVEYVQSMRYPQ